MDSTALLKEKIARFQDQADSQVFNEAVILTVENRIKWKDLEDWARKENCLPAFKQLKQAYCKVLKKR